MEKVKLLLTALMIAGATIPKTAKAWNVNCDSNGTCYSQFIYKTEYENETIPMTFDISSGYVNDHSVCANLKYGTLKQRACREAAEEMFKDVCQQDQNADNHRKLYCVAADEFNPVN